jgi:phosphoglycerate kinase
MSLAPVAPALAKLLGASVAFADDCVGEAAKAAIEKLPAGGVILLENTRYHAGEEKNDPELAKQIAALGDFYVNDAFSAAHRAHASTEGVAHILPAYAGKQMERELDALDAALGNPKRPVLGIVGGAKVSTKLDLLQNLIAKLDKLAIGGGMANTFLYAQGVEIGASLAERDMADAARAIMDAAKGKCELLLPVDVVVAKEVKPHAEARMCGLKDIQADDKILDAGEETVKRLRQAMQTSHTLIWNGPLGVFEVPPVRPGHRDRRAGSRRAGQGRQARGRGRRRRHRGGAQPRRRRRRHDLRLHRRGRVPGVDGRQGAAGGGGAETVRAAVAKFSPCDPRGVAFSAGPR